jgi:MFS family permease
MMQILVPLYAVSLGYSILQIGSIVGVPVLATIAIRFVGGALADRFGENRTLLGCYFLNAMGAAMLFWADSFTTLIAALVVANLSRSTFWIPAQSLASQLSVSQMGKKLGQLSACNHGGALLGQSLGGVMAAFLGFPVSFLILTGTALLCFLLGLLVPPAKAKPAGRSIWQITHGIGDFLRYRRTWLAISASFAAAVPVSLTQSVYPVYLTQLEYGKEWIGVAVSVRSLGPVAIGLTLASLITPSRQRSIYALGMAGLGLFVLGSGLTEHLFIIGLCVGALGAAGGVMDLWYQVQTSDLSDTSDRSVAMASTGMGWNIAPFLMPILVGWLADVRGFKVAFLTTGLLFFLIAAGTNLWHRLLSQTGLVPKG